MRLIGALRSRCHLRRRDELVDVAVERISLFPPQSSLVRIGILVAMGGSWVLSILTSSQVRRPLTA
jgi:hypothetical protein